MPEEKEELQTRTPQQNPEKDPQDWVTGEEPMTGPQKSYLHTLAQEAGEEIDPNLTKAQASERIEELQRKTGRVKLAWPDQSFSIRQLEQLAHLKT